MISWPNRSSQNGRLAHAWRNGAVAGPALATDYAAMINAAVTLHLATGRTAISHGRGRLGGTTGNLALRRERRLLSCRRRRSDLLVRARSEQDEAVPSATAMAIEGTCPARHGCAKPGSDRARRSGACGRLGPDQGQPASCGSESSTRPTPSCGHPSWSSPAPHRSEFGGRPPPPDPARLDLRLTDPEAISRHIGASGDRSTARRPISAAAPSACRPSPTPASSTGMLARAGDA